MSDRLKVVHMVLSLDVGGLERLVLDLTREGKRLGHEITILCLERPGTLAPDAEGLGSRIICTHKKPGLRPSTVGSIRSVLREVQPDVVHSHTIAALFYGGPAAWSAGVPLMVHTEHSNNVGWESSRRKAWLWWLAGSFARRFFCVSRDIADELERGRVIPRSRLRVMMNGIDTVRVARPTDTAGLRRSLGIPAAAPVIGTVGRLNPVKRQEVLVRAFARLRAAIPDAHLVLVGDGPSRDELRGLVAQLGVEDSVHFAGYQAEPERFLQIMNVFALTSGMEGLPLSILEAWAVGLPVVASAVGGVPDLIAEGEDGFLFPSGDEEKLAAILADLLRNPERARQIGNAARRKVTEQYDLRRMADDYDREYRELLGNRRVVVPSEGEKTVLSKS